MDPSVRRRRLIVRGAALVVVAAAWLFVRFRRRAMNANRLSYAPMAQRDAERQNNLRFIYHSDDTRCVDLLRMKRQPFFQLCDLFRTRGLLRDSVHTSVEEQVAMFLHVVGHNQRFRVIGLSFRRSIETISRLFQEVLYAVGELRGDMIQPPAADIPTKILHSSRWNPYFKDCIGAIDGTHVLARVPAAQKAAFLGRKHTTTHNVLAAVDFDLKFTYVLAGWEGSAHDALILADAIERNDGLSVPQGNITCPFAQGQNAAAAPARLTWTPVMSAFILRRFVDLCEGVKTDKGFKDVHLNAVAKDLTAVIGEEVSGNQVYNHLRKWRAKWVKISKLKELSGACWDEENYMITLDGDHYNGHCKAHPKDAQYLNTPIANYLPMQIIFGSGVATGRFAMGSNEPLGQPIDLDAVVDLDGDLTPNTDSTGKAPEMHEPKVKGESSHLGKRKRVHDNEAALMTGLTEAVWGFANAVAESNHNEAAPGLYRAVMDMADFPREALMVALGHLTENKASGLMFVQMTTEDKDLWLRTFLSKAYY
ncbi:hypothetical protein U9M48_025291, partial [Paspalum notatum var. saurae]